MKTFPMGADKLKQWKEQLRILLMANSYAVRRLRLLMERI